MRRPSLRTLLPLLAPLVLAALFFTCFERKQIDVDVGYSAAARRNPYLALARVLERMGHPVVAIDRYERLAELPEPPATLLLPVNRNDLSGSRSEALLRWVERGGRLIVVTYTLWEDPDRRPDPLLDRFDLRQHLQEPIYAEDEDEDEDEDDDAEREPIGWRRLDPQELEPEELGRLNAFAWIAEVPLHGAQAWLPGLPEPLEVGFVPRYAWEDAGGRGQVVAASDAGAHVVAVPHGKGTLIAFTDDLLLRSERLDEDDHAEFGLRLLRGETAAPQPVWILPRAEWPGPLALLRRYAGPPLVALAVAVALWVWRSARRFGPQRPPALAARRRWLEHLEAAGGFHWRRDRGHALLDEAREALVRDLRARHPDWWRRSERERLARVASLAGVTPGEARWVLEGGTPLREGVLVGTVVLLERIRAAM